MKFIYKLLACFIIINCTSCIKPPCVCDFAAHQFIEIKFINQQGQNLIFGPAALYQIDSIQVLKKENNFNINNASVRKGIIDSNNVEFDFYVAAGKNYIYYKQTQQDSLEIKWIVKTDKCCGNNQEYNFIDSVKFNNVYIKDVNGVYTFVK